jgi:tagatose-1,6-bisphosphate aldolase non-catalytic subunit AgaZ/GatZ
LIKKLNYIEDTIDKVESNADEAVDQFSSIAAKVEKIYKRKDGWWSKLTSTKFAIFLLKIWKWKSFDKLQAYWMKSEIKKHLNAVMIISFLDFLLLLFKQLCVKLHKNVF